MTSGVWRADVSQAGGATLLLAALSFSGPCWAETDGTCAPVVEALRGLGAAPHYHWTVTATTPARRRPMEREQIVIGDVVYQTPDEGRWMQQRITRAERIAKMEEELSRNPPMGCQLMGTESRGGAEMQVYAYRQGAGEKRIWIGSADHLPHGFTSSEPSVSVVMSVNFVEVTPPLR